MKNFIHGAPWGVALTFPHQVTPLDGVLKKKNISRITRSCTNFLFDNVVLKYVHYSFNILKISEEKLTSQHFIFLSINETQKMHRGKK